MKKYKAIVPELEIKYKSGEIHKIKINSSKDAEQFFRKIFDEDTIEAYETMVVVYLNRINNTIGWFKVSQGGISGTIVDLRLILAVGVKTLASSMILCHNHPSGGVMPSKKDIELTKRLKEAGDILDITLLDHLIITSNDYMSFVDEGIIK